MFILNYLPYNPESGVKVQMIFKRRLMNVAMTTFFPSMLPISITYATTYFKPAYFEAALTVNLTVILVMTTLFIIVMDNLAPTFYIKWIEYWLIFAQLIPFTEVVLLAIQEKYRDGKVEYAMEKDSVKKVGGKENKIINCWKNGTENEVITIVVLDIFKNIFE